MTTQKVYILQNARNTNMLPGDLQRSPDDCFLKSSGRFI